MAKLTFPLCIATLAFMLSLSAKDGDSVAKSLDWHLSEFATVTDGILTVDVPEDAPSGMYGATAELDLDLPTEAQWEFACRAGTTTAMYNGKPNAGTWGNSDCNDIAWFTGTSEQKPHAVGGKLPNDWGFYDMYGNVREWCLDWYATYPDTPAVDPNGPTSGTERVIRSSYY